MMNEPGNNAQTIGLSPIARALIKTGEEFFDNNYGDDPHSQNLGVGGASFTQEGGEEK